jgi:hypothetical protein
MWLAKLTYFIVVGNSANLRGFAKSRDILHCNAERQPSVAAESHSAAAAVGGYGSFSM